MKKLIVVLLLATPLVVYAHSSQDGAINSLWAAIKNESDTRGNLIKLVIQNQERIKKLEAKIEELEKN